MPKITFTYSFTDTLTGEDRKSGTTADLGPDDAHRYVTAGVAVPAVPSSSKSPMTPDAA